MEHKHELREVVREVVMHSGKKHMSSILFKLRAQTKKQRNSVTRNQNSGTKKNAGDLKNFKLKKKSNFQYQNELTNKNNFHVWIYILDSFCNFWNSMISRRLFINDVFIFRFWRHKFQIFLFVIFKCFSTFKIRFDKEIKFTSRNCMGMKTKKIIDCTRATFHCTFFMFSMALESKL